MTASAVSWSLVLACTTGVLHSSLRSYLRTLPGVTIVAQVNDAHPLTETLAAHRPQLLLLDADLPHLDIATHLPLLIRRSPDLRVIVIAGSRRRQAAAYAAGAHHVLLQGDLGASLRDAILGRTR